MADLPKAAVVRLAKKAGAVRVGEDAADALVAKAEAYIEAIATPAERPLRQRTSTSPQKNNQILCGVRV
jgi:histone H3/H4